MRPMVAIVGRPNVGKSTLFNRLVGRRMALVEDAPGVTRDRNYADAEIAGKQATLIDTGGFLPGDRDQVLAAVREQAQLAIEECQQILFVCDGRGGLTGAEDELARLLRRSGKQVIVVANKLDSLALERASPLHELARLGFGEVVGVSAEHGRGFDHLAERIAEALPEQVEAGEDEQRELDESGAGEEGVASEPAPARLAIIGRPNVGKSTLINALLGQNRLVASEIPGTTRDPIDSPLSWGEHRFVLTDTAGIRRKKTIAHRVEHFAVVAALKAVDRSDVAVLLMDASEPAVDQDAKLAGVAEEKGKALLLVVNKWDLVPPRTRKQEAFRDELKLQLRFIGYAPIVFTSALHKEKVEKVLELAAALYAQTRFRAPTPRLNKLLAHITEHHPLPFAHGKPLRLYYIAQVGIEPPTFALTCNRPEQIPERYKRYVMNQLRETFGLQVPIRLLFRERPGKRRRAGRR